MRRLWNSIKCVFKGHDIETVVTITDDSTGKRAIAGCKRCKKLWAYIRVPGMVSLLDGPLVLRIDNKPQTLNTMLEMLEMYESFGHLRQVEVLDKLVGYIQ